MFTPLAGAVGGGDVEPARRAAVRTRVGLRRVGGDAAREHDHRCCLRGRVMLLPKPCGCCWRADVAQRLPSARRISAVIRPQVLSFLAAGVSSVVCGRCRAPWRSPWRSVEFEVRPASHVTVSDLSNRSIRPLQLSSMPLPTTSMAPGFTSVGFAPQRPGSSQQSPSLEPAQPSPSQSVVCLLQVPQTPVRHDWPLGQALPQVPQLFLSFCVSTQRAAALLEASAAAARRTDRLRRPGRRRTPGRSRRSGAGSTGCRRRPCRTWCCRPRR